jgi:hypothetical protein
LSSGQGFFVDRKCRNNPILNNFLKAHACQSSAHFIIGDGDALRAEPVFHRIV